MREWWLGPSLAAALVSFGGCTKDPPAPASAPVAAAEPDAPTIAPVARVATTDRWLDLLAQRPSAVTMHEGNLVVDLGRKSAYKHHALASAATWSTPQLVGDRLATVVTGRTAELDLPVDGPNAPGLHPDTEEHAGLAIAVTMYALVEDQSVTVLWNEQTLAHLRLSSGWERRTLSIPADTLRQGDNRLRLHFRHVATEGEILGSAALGRIELGPHEAITKPRDAAADPIAGYEITPRPDGGARLTLPAGHGLAYYVVPPRRGRLRLQVRGRGQVQIVASTDADHEQGREPTVLLDEPLRPAGVERDLDLTAWGGAPARIEIRARGNEPDAAAQLDGLHILARRSVPRDERARMPRDVYIVGIEGARTDSFLEPGRRPPLESIEALLRESIVFERAYALGAAAVPSHAAWLSSVIPPVHLTVAGTYVADAQVLLPEALARAGYVRALVSANADVTAERGLQQGFDLTELLDKQMEERDARAVVARAEALLRDKSQHRLLYAVVNDPQAPYEASRELVGPVTVPPDAPLSHLTHVWVGRVRMGKHEPSEDELTYVRRLYRGELRVVDEAVGDLVEDLREQGRLDDAIIVLVGLHAEEFYEHRGAGHGHTLYEESIRVPLAIRAPALLASGRVDTPVDLLDLAPTILDLVGGTAPDAWQGETLVPVIDDPQPPPRLVVAYLGDGSRAAIVGEHKLIVGPGRVERMYALADDPGEQQDVLATGGIALRMVRTALAWQTLSGERWRRARWGTGANLRPAFAQDFGM